MNNLKYIPRPWTFDHRMEMCNAVNEGSEIEDIVKTLTTAARMLHAFEDHFCDIVLIIAEKLCEDYVTEEIWSRQCSWEEYMEFDPEVYKHFTGGATKLSKEDFERLKNRI